MTDSHAGHTLTKPQRAVLLAVHATPEGRWTYKGAWVWQTVHATARICEQLVRLGLLEGQWDGYSLTPLGREWGERHGAEKEG